jgi:putative NADH-flavin reductase
MKGTIAVFGGSGKTGYEFVLKALDAGWKVKALARRPEMLAPHHFLEVVPGDVLDGGKVMYTVSGADAVIVSLGNTKNNPDFLVSKGTELILKAMDKFSVSRILAVSSMGVGNSAEQVPWFFKVLSKTLIRKMMLDKEKQEKLLFNSDKDWTIIRPGGLTKEPEKGQYKVGTDTKYVSKVVSRRDVAAFMLKCLEEKLYIKETPYISD